MMNKNPFGKKAIISDDVRNYDNHPFFLKKAEQARKAIEQAGLPPQVKRMQDEAAKSARKG